MKYIRIHPLTPLAFAAAFLLGCGKYFSLLYLFIFLHETFHLCAALLSGGRPSALLLLPYGCMLTLRLPPGGIRGVFVFFAGPLFNLILFLLDFFPKENLILALFNLIPVPPLDGGMICSILFPKASPVIALLSAFFILCFALFHKKLLFLPAVLFVFIVIEQHKKIEKRVMNASRKFIGKGIEKK